jgi:ABC-type transport system involved in Fe-S cluster assembly fused permease/ATPase subunit
MTALDKLAVSGLLTNSPDDMAKFYALIEIAMNGLRDDPEASRLQILARTIALLRAKIEVLEGLADAALDRRDFVAVTAIQKVLDGTTRRMTMLVVEHRLATQGGHRNVAVAVVGQAAQVNVQAVR